jgi:peptidoglycan/xylan/chitin deacetylase (PgdA/CDA1 family)
VVGDASSDYSRQMASADEIAGTVLVYHAIGKPPPGADSDDLFVEQGAFEEQLLYLAAHRRVLSLGALIDGDLEPGKPAVAITFDDGFRSALTAAAPLLERFGFPATAFVTTRWLDGSDGGDTAQTEAAGGTTLELLTTADVQALGERGFEIGSHGHTHADLGRLSASIVEAELVASADRLESLLGKRPRYLAWPYGSSSSESEAVAKAVGFDAAFAFNTPTTSRYSLSRVPVYRLDGRVLFGLKTSGRYIALRRSPVVASTYEVLGPVISRSREWLPRRRHQVSGSAR